MNGIDTDNLRIFIEFYSGVKGGVCNDESHVIRNQKECLKAITDVGFIVKLPLWTNKYPNLPSGCSINDGGKPFFETSLSGIGTGREDLTPVCQGSLASGRSFLSLLCYSLNKIK